MSGSNSSAPGSRAGNPPAGATRDVGSPVGLTVHSVATPALTELAARRTSSGRWRMLLVLAVCTAPVIASYFTYFVIRPEGRTNYSDLITPLRQIPAELALADLQGHAVAPATLVGQWLLVVVAGGACDAVCERHLWLQRQLRETLGREKSRIEKVWLIPDAATPSAQTLAAIGAPTTPATVLRVSRSALAAWLQPAAGQALEAHMYVVDPLGNWMMRVPPDADPVRLKRDVEKLLRASAGWDQPGR